MNMNQDSFLIRFLRKIGIDKAIAYSSGSRIVAGITGVVTVFLIAIFLTGEEQGYYFTFGSLLALQVFFELGLSSIMTQYVAHECSHLELGSDYQYIGEDFYISRLSSLVHFCVKWYSVLSVVVFVFLIITGYCFFTFFNGDVTYDVDWLRPWVVICIATAIKLFQSPLSSIYMGLGYVKEVSMITFYQQIVQPVTIWLFLILGFKLYAIGIGYLLSCLLWFYLVYRVNLHKLTSSLWREKITERVEYFKEIFPFQWKIAVSWISGYFIYQLFNPVLFATEGAVVAGQMGLTISVLSTIQSFSNSWITTKVPLFSKYIALKQYNQLDNVYNKTNIQMSMICLALLIAFIMFVLGLKITGISVGDSIIGERFLGILPTILMSIAIFSNIWLTSWGIYLRCHKQEPLLVFSVTSGIMCCLSTVGLGNLWGLMGITTGYCIIMVLSIPWAYHIYVKCKKEWHDE